jgi:hypothetical protein
MKRRTIFLIILLNVGIVSLIFPRYQHPVSEADRSAAYEYARSKGDTLPPYAFATDGCTLFPDRLPLHDLRAICVTHDIRYWLGGTAEERREVDLAFKDAITHTGPFGKPLSNLMFMSVRAFGDSALARLHNANWGFGYNNHEFPF